MAAQAGLSLTPMTGFLMKRLTCILGDGTSLILLTLLLIRCTSMFLCFQFMFCQGFLSSSKSLHCYVHLERKQVIVEIDISFVFFISLSLSLSNVTHMNIFVKAFSKDFEISKEIGNYLPN